MKYLFIVQGDGRGHMTQAIALSEILKRNGHEVVEVLVGKSISRSIPSFFYDKIGAKVKLYDTPSFIYKSNLKQIHPLKTLAYNIKPKRLKIYAKSIELIYRRIKKTNPDVVVNFYEMLAGFTNLRFKLDIPFINIGHQYLIKHPDYVHAKSEEQGMMLFRLQSLLCSIGATKTLALSFYPLKDYIPERIAVVPPLLRREIFDITATQGNYILGYMVNQGYEDEVRAWHKNNPDVELHIFWDKKDAAEETIVDKTLTFHSLNDQKFINYMARCSGYITTAGFESVCEAFYLDKPIMMIPVHIEQEVNAADAASTGNGIIGESFNVSKLLAFLGERTSQTEDFKKWVNSAEDIFIRHLTTFV